MNGHLLHLTKIILNELPAAGKSNVDIIHSQNTTLVSVFSERAKLLLLQYLYHTIIS